MRITIERRELAAQEDGPARDQALAFYDMVAEGRAEVTLVWDTVAMLWLSQAYPWVYAPLGLRVVAPGADLRGADLRGVNLQGAFLEEADLTGAARSPNDPSVSGWAHDGGYFRRATAG